MSRWLALATLLLACTDPPHPRTPDPPKRPASTVAAEVATPTSELVPVYADDPSLGPKTAPVTIVMWSDFQCPFCSRVKPTMQALRAKYGDQLRIVWKDLPLDFHKHAREAAVVARVVFLMQGSDTFWHFHDQLFEHQAALSTESIHAWASVLGVDSASLQTYRDEAEAKVERSLADSKRLGIQGTPNFMIDGQVLTGAQPVDKFAAVIDAHLEKAKELTANGTAPGDVYPALVKTFYQTPVPEVEEPEPPPDPTVWSVPLNNAPVRGAKSALITIVTFSDLQCTFCKRVEGTFAQLEKEYPGKLRFVWKDNPLSFHKRAMPAANAAREVRKQKGDDAFWKFQAAVFAGQPKLEDEDLEAYAAAIPGVDSKKVRAAAEKEKYRADIDKDLEQSENLKIGGTPHSFVNGRTVNGAQPLAKWKVVIDEELAKAEAKVKAGVPAEKIYDDAMKTAKSAGPIDLKIPADAPWRGGANAKVVLHVFSEFQCPFCRRLARDIPDAAGTGAMAKIEKKYGDKIKLVWRDFPLAFLARARAAAAFAREAKKQKGMAVFWKVHDELFDLGGVLEDDKLEEIAKRYGIDWGKARLAIANGTHDALIDADMKIGGDAGVTGTPATFINGRALVGAQPEEAFIKMIDRELAKK
jgi:protein-disulfide isomerase